MPGTSAAVSTLTTPGTCSAAETSSSSMRARACGACPRWARSTSVLRPARSSVYSAVPVTCRVADSCGSGRPTTGSAGRSASVLMLVLLLGLCVELAQRLAEHRRAVLGAGAVVAHRGALGGQDLRCLLHGVELPGRAEQRVLGSHRTDRGGGYATGADPRPADHAVRDLQGEREGDTGDVVETALGDLVERHHRRQRQRDEHCGDQLVGGLHALPVAGEVLRERYSTPAGRRDQLELGVQGEQHRRGVSDRGAGTEVAAQGGAVAAQPGGELPG